MKYHENFEYKEPLQKINHIQYQDDDDDDDDDDDNDNNHDDLTS